MKKHKKQKRKKNNISFEFIIENEIKNNKLRTFFPNNFHNLNSSNFLSSKKEHEDLTKIDFLTIDGEDSKDFDDAVFVKKKDSTLQIFIAIADVSFYVKSNDIFDVEAKKRGNSFYLPNMAIPMLPEYLSNNICSLIPGEKRKCIVLKSEIDFEGNILNSKISRSEIISKQRLTYEKVEEIFYNKSLKQQVIDDLFFCYEILKKNSDKRGKIDFNLQEFKIEVNKTNVSIKKLKKFKSTKIIEELMIFANSTIARHLSENNIKSIYRNHKKPSNEKIEKLILVLKKLNIKTNKNVIENSKSQNYFSKLIKHPKFNFLKDILLKTQSKAYYHYENQGHYGLGLKHYTHFTSPIRRYSDLLVHRIICASFFHNNKNEIHNISDSLCEHLLEQEKKGELLERGLIEKACCIHIKNMKKKYFSGFIDGLTNFGIFIKALELPFTGFVKLKDITGDFYKFNEKNEYIYGKRTDNVFKLGQKVSFKVKNVNILKGQISICNIKHSND